jgi:hypothetical protein
LGKGKPIFQGFSPLLGCRTRTPFAVENIVAVVPPGGYIHTPEAKPAFSGVHLGKTGSYRFRTDIAT